MNAEATEIGEAELDDAAQALRIRWGDAHQSVYPLKYLRAECPCAACRTEREEHRSNPFRVITQIPSAEIVDIEAVGRYAMRFTWKDGHQTGIYTFEHLREICPCELCKAGRGEEPPFVHGIHIPRA